MSTNPLQNLIVDYWYKAITVAGLFIFVISLTVNLVDVSNNVVQLISIGAFFIGLGEWSNHPLQTILIQEGQLTGYPRNTSMIGILFDLLGLLLIGLGIYSIYA